MERITLKPKEERRLLRGHLWAYRNEFASLPDLEDGALVEIASSTGRFIGTGFYQAEGGIAVRVLAHSQQPIDAAFLARRVDKAKSLRDRLFPEEPVYRWVHGESDGLPGLVADRYGERVVVQSACQFYCAMAEDLARAFLLHDGVKTVCWSVCGNTQYFGEEGVEAKCTVNGLTWRVDAEHGQKTGMFLDQRQNWPLLKPFVRGARVLDGYCYTGAWGLHAAHYGAEEVVGVDTSDAALEVAREQARVNGHENACRFECGDVQQRLGQGDRFDVVILDPPAFAKSRRHLGKALGLYRAVNRDALKILNPGGFLVTCSCSSALEESAFLEIIKRAANAARRQVRLLEVRGASPDHPVLLAMPETRYLKCALLEVR